MRSWLFIALLLASSCGVEKPPKPYTLLTLGDPEKSCAEAAFIDLRFTFRDAQGKLIAVHRVEGLNPTKLMPKYLLDMSIAEWSEGDSVEWTDRSDSTGLRHWNLLDYAKQASSVRIKVLKAESDFNNRQQRAEMRSQGDLEMLEAQEAVLWPSLLDSFGMQPIHQFEGIYFRLTKEGSGMECRQGATVVVDFKAWLGTGTLIDDTYAGNELECVFGKPDQMINGFELALSRMREGDKAVAIIPSSLGYGPAGSSSGLVPPFACLVYEIQLQRVLREAPL